MQKEQSSNSTPKTKSALLDKYEKQNEEAEESTKKRLEQELEHKKFKEEMEAQKKFMEEAINRMKSAIAE